jgi:hypothetical protein
MTVRQSDAQEKRRKKKEEVKKEERSRERRGIAESQTPDPPYSSSGLPRGVPGRVKEAICSGRTPQELGGRKGRRS